MVSTHTERDIEKVSIASAIALVVMLSVIVVAIDAILLILTQLLYTVEWQEE